jgi:hypothetical protein
MVPFQTQNSNDGHLSSGTVKFPTWKNGPSHNSSDSLPSVVVSRYAITISNGPTFDGLTPNNGARLVMNSNVDEIKIDDPLILSDQIVQFDSDSAPESVSIVLSCTSILEWHIVTFPIIDAPDSITPIPIPEPVTTFEYTFESHMNRTPIEISPPTALPVPIPAPLVASLVTVDFHMLRFPILENAFC